MTESIVDVESVLKIGQIVKLRLPVANHLHPTDHGKSDAYRVCSSHVQDLLSDDIVISWPTERGVDILVDVGQRVELLMASPRGLVLLDSHIVAKSRRPLPMLSVSRRGKWSVGQFRENVRLDITVTPHEVMLVSKELDDAGTRNGGGAASHSGSPRDRGEPVEGIIHNLSAGGIQLAST
ncbi:MAG: flagellar brake protein, partial [Chloroflexi bacterium]|nr:flagellar brake protein [Chloroflexota bacterium]